jgi:undecaprenyl-diphosphatase
MDWILLGKALLLGVVEGLTEFLPVSSTGHLILVGDLLDFNDEKGKIFEIVIQCGAILAVCWEYRAKFLSVIRGLFSDRAAQRFVLNLAVAFVPLVNFYLFYLLCRQETQGPNSYGPSPLRPVIPRCSIKPVSRFIKTK